MPIKKEVIIGDCRLILGDCLEVMPLLGKVDMVLVDPPYGTTACKWDSVISLKSMWEVMPSSEKTAVVMTAQTPFDKVLGCSNLVDLRYEWIWEKTAPTGHLNAKRMPMKAHENILVFYKSLPTYNPQRTTGHDKKVSSAYHKRNSKKAAVYGDFNASEYASTERYPRSILTFSSDKQTESAHPTQKPVALMEYLINTYTNAGDTVLDFTMGSGTTLVACAKMGRKGIGIELDRDYFEIAVERVTKAYEQPDFLREPQKAKPEQKQLEI